MFDTPFAEKALSSETVEVGRERDRKRKRSDYEMARKRRKSESEVKRTEDEENGEASSPIGIDCGDLPDADDIIDFGDKRRCLVS